MISIKIKGLDQALKAIRKFPGELDRLNVDTGAEVSQFVLEDQGGGKPFYPPQTAANRPPVPYYVRGVGTQTRTGNTNSSEQMDRQFYFNTRPRKLYIGNEASYAPSAIGDQQSRTMAGIGWKRLIDVARSKIGGIVAIWQRRVDEVIKRLKL